MKRKNICKGQVSIELLVIVGFILAVFIPILFFSYMKSDELRSSSMNVLATGVGKKVSSAVESVYYSGQGSSLRFLVSVPRGTTINFTCDCDKCLSGIIVNQLNSEIFILTKGCINTSKSDELKEGTYSIKVLYTKEGIVISRD